ncbi:dihydrodipicolinate synthase family protein [Microvirga subterranea]|uniref:4-hydroxy-tetrahydrodipicolinate synthase n=1 Tax=Microvirga subterranea TaxID=186651 RepID=A0A370H5T1_9HYPH|nr:dihydrodipicolinate synthase family protein [Microvirga subterranea]RDI51370.1 4-hydroxy-tetrahydrodipicolinate synthase [Microvirga subterranea]
MLQGIFPVLPTPFSTTGGVDPDAIDRIVDFALAAGVDGVVFPGFASEVDDLRADERASLLRRVVERVAGRVPVVAGASAPSAEEAIAHAREALAAGVRFTMIQAPKSVGVDAAAVAAFYRAIAAAVPEIEIVLQNAPAPRGSDLKPDVILAIVKDNPAVTYVKEETLPAGPAITAILKERPAHLKGVIGGGGARYIIDEYRRGACGAMPAVEIADVHVAFDRAFRSGDIAKARDLYMRTLPLLVIQANFRMAFTKYVLTRRGILSSRIARAKLPPMDDMDLSEIDAWLKLASPLLTTGAAAFAGAAE